MGPIALLNLAYGLLFALLWVAAAGFLRLKRKKSLVYVLFFSIFSLYLFKVLDYTLFQFQSLLLLKHFMPGLMLQGAAGEEALNLIPLITLTVEDMVTSLLNVLMLVPFGFGLPFIMNARALKVICLGAAFSIGIELAQLTTGIVASITFRVADVNDIIFNTLGVAIGYALFIGFAHAYRHSALGQSAVANPILRYIAERSGVVNRFRHQESRV